MIWSCCNAFSAALCNNLLLSGPIQKAPNLATHETEKSLKENLDSRTTMMQILFESNGFLIAVVKLRTASSDHQHPVAVVVDGGRQTTSNEC